MIETEEVLAQSGEFNVILLVGLSIFFGTAGARIFQKLRIPQIIGYLVIGIILGPLLKMMTPATIEVFEPFNVFALGIIGFLIGGELKRDVFVKFGRQVTSILLFEGLVAFLLVAVLSFVVMLNFAGWQTAAAVGAVFGAICAATDPASTANVLWEYKSRGPLTTMLIAIVALDDALALVLYIVCISLAGFLTGHQESSLLYTGFHASLEIAGSLVLGVIAGQVLRWIIKRLDDNEKVLVFAIGVIVLTIGLAQRFEMDVILSSMALGVTLINTEPRRSLRTFDVIRKFSPPIYVLFFVIVGARLNITNITFQICLLSMVYVFGNIIGKTSGAYLGAVYSKSVPTVRKYLGICLYQQGTIAIALLLMASRRFEGDIRENMLSVIIIGVFLLQLAGPLFVKLGIKKAGEAGMNITEEDLIKIYTVGDVMDTKVPVISSGMAVSEVIKIVSNTDKFYYSVVDTKNNLVGAITLDGIRNTFTTQEVNEWLIALDIAEPVIAEVEPKTGLSKALEKAKELDIEYVPVTVSAENKQFAGIMDCRAVRRQLSSEVLERQQKADRMAGLPVT